MFIESHFTYFWIKKQSFQLVDAISIGYFETTRKLTVGKFYRNVYIILFFLFDGDQESLLKNQSLKFKIILNKP